MAEDPVLEQWHAWAAGEATFRLELIAGTTLLDSKSVTVFLNIIP